MVAQLTEEAFMDRLITVRGTRRPELHPPNLISHPHSTRLALRPGDELVLVTSTSNLFDKQAEITPITRLNIEEIYHNPLRWAVTTDQGLKIRGEADSACLVHQYLKLEAEDKVVKKDRGLCTLFRAYLTHGYRIHYLDFLRERFPETYDMLFS